MKRMMLVLLMVLCMICSGLASAEMENGRLDIAFGLFSVALPEGTLPPGRTPAINCPISALRRMGNRA